MLGVVACAASPFVGVACESRGRSGFCEDAEAAVEQSYPSGGGDVSERLGAVVPDGLSVSNAAAWRAAVESVTDQLRAFRDGKSSEGWSTQPAATAASRVCGSEIASFNVMP